MSLFRILSFLFFFLAAGSSFAQIRFNSGSAFSMDYANPRKFEIGGITVSGAQYLDSEALISITGLKVGDQINIPGDQISKAIQKLWDQGILGDIEVSATKIEGSYIFLDFKLTERPRLSKFTFNGINKSNADDLREKIRLIRGKVVTESLINNTRSTVRKYYIGKGFMDVKVNIKQERDSSLANSVILIIDIDKKKKVKIDNITFDGNESIPDNKLAKSMKNTKEKRFYKLLTTSKFIRSGYEEDKQAVINKYNAEGFRDAAIVKDTVYVGDNGRLNINITVDEGPKYYFRNITWSGNYIYDDKYLSSILGIKKGTVYSKDILDKRLNYNPSGMDITSLYMDDGYLFFSIDPEEVLVEGDSIDIEMRIYEGAQARINAVNVSGNTKTSDHVILRELRTVPGQKFSRSDLIRSQRELAQLGYFDPEQIGINPIPNQADGTV
ncbi:MAG: outer membrane protein assembly factor BamA, partial [Chitinophagaceae bacterium]